MNFFKDHLNLSNNIYDNAKILKAAEINKQQEIIDRNPTTKYYQTLAQNLQEQVQYLKKMLSESDRPLPTQGVPEQMTDQERYELTQDGRMRNFNEPHPNQNLDPNVPRPFSGPGTFPTFKSKHPVGSPNYLRDRREWILKNWHADNPYPYASPEWFEWEIDEQENPPMRKNTPEGTPGTFNYGPPSPNSPFFPTM
jgi:hypothetical protein